MASIERSRDETSPTRELTEQELERVLGAAATATDSITQLQQMLQQIVQALQSKGR